LSLQQQLSSFGENLGTDFVLVMRGVLFPSLFFPPLPFLLALPFCERNIAPAEWIVPMLKERLNRHRGLMFHSFALCENDRSKKW
jgi:hypothetical protein